MTVPMSNQRIIDVELDDRTIIRRSPDIEQEKRVAIFDLLEENVFRPLDCQDEGPFHLHLGIEDNRLVFDVRDTRERELTRIQLPITPFRTIVKDYFLICDSYFQAIKGATPSRIEAIDMARRGLHNEGSDLLREALDGRVVIDHNTARRLFTLVCVLHIRG